VDASVAVLEGWRKSGAEFYLLHLSDEFGQDRVDIYAWKECLGVLRNYVRGDIQVSEKVRWIPLGWHWAIHNGEPGIHSPRPPFREYVWSFAGTRWAGREAKLQVLEGVEGPKKLLWMDEWNSPKQLTKDQTLELLMNSWMVPCPGGQNFETFRIYEALEAGALPIFVQEGSAKPFLLELSKWLPLIVADTWPKAAQTIHTLRAKPEVYEQVRAQTLVAWEKFKGYVKDSVKTIYSV
jgi:hypothetical protein